MLKTLLKCLILTTSLFFLHNASLAQISNPDGDITTVNPELFWPQTLEGSHFNEFWNYHFYFNNGVILHIVFNAANFGSLKSPVTGVRVSVHNLDDETHQLLREYSLDHLFLDKENEKFQLRREREIYIQGVPPESHRIRIYTTKDGVTYDIDLNFENIQPGIKWGDGNFRIGREKIGIVTHIPYADVSGTVAVNENKAEVTGTGYMDHTYQDQTTTTLIDSGFRFTYHEDAQNWDLAYFLLPNKSDRNKTIGYRVVNRNGNIELKGGYRINQIVESSAFDKNIARIIELKRGNNQSFRLVRSEDHEKFSLLGELGWLARRAARTFLGGEVIDFRGEASLMESGQRPKAGYYNYFIVD